MNDINLNILTNKINELYDDGFKSVFKIIQKNDEKYIKTKNYYLIDLDNVKQETLIELNNFINYLDETYKNLKTYEIEKNKLKNDILK